MVACVRKPTKVKKLCVGLSFEDGLHMPPFNTIVGHATNHETRRHVFIEPVEYWLRIVSQNIDSIDSHNCAAQRWSSRGRAVVATLILRMMKRNMLPRLACNDLFGVARSRPRQPPAKHDDQSEN